MNSLTNKNNNNLKESSIVCSITDTYPLYHPTIFFSTFDSYLTLGNIVGSFALDFYPFAVRKLFYIFISLI